MFSLLIYFNFPNVKGNEHSDVLTFDLTDVHTIYEKIIINLKNPFGTFLNWV
jgi:hypothetical protein